MTQEELDALMNGDVDIDALDEEVVEEDTTSSDDEHLIDEDSAENAEHYRVRADNAWPPPPPTDDNKMVHQLDDVTKESEEKATEIFDIADSVSMNLGDIEEEASASLESIDSNIEMLETLTAKFPNVQTFKTALENTQQLKTKIETIAEHSQMGGDSIMQMMDVMQYQDIHRQKIERVINVMRALSTYMNHLFAGKIDDTKRVTSAKHIHGDTDTLDVVSNDDIEALLDSFGQG